MNAYKFTTAGMGKKIVVSKTLPSAEKAFALWQRKQRRLPQFSTHHASMFVVTAIEYIGEVIE